MDDVISRLSDIRSQYNCFNESEETYYRALSEAIKMLSEQADGDTISRQAAIEVADAVWSVTGDVNVAKVWDQIRNLPSAQPERKTGIWLKTGQSFVFPDKFRNYFCSECGFEIEKTAYNYCPNCGADMREPEDIPMEYFESGGR